VLVGCRRETEDWSNDLLSDDPWRREVAAVALRSVEDEEVDHTVHLLLRRLIDHEPRVKQAITDSLAALAPRAVEPMVQALRIVAPKRDQHRELLVRLLSERARAGDERARGALLEHLRQELENADPARVEKAHARIAELELEAPRPEAR
jgi:hypothetical protein